MQVVFPTAGSARRGLYLLLSILVLKVLLLCPPTSLAEIYRWQDSEGHWHFSDSPSTTDADLQQLPAYSQPQQPAEASQDLVETTAQQDEGGLFWKIAKQGLRPSYLMGTIHSTDPRVTQLRPAVSQTLDQADRFVMEMIMDANAFLQFSSTMMITDGRTLENLIGTALFRKVAPTMADFGMPETVVQQLKPWVVMAMLSMPKPDGGTILDMVLYQQAQNRGKPTAGLESAEEQLAVFEGMSLDDQISMLKMTIDQLPALPGMFEQMIQAYVADDLKRIGQLAAQYKNQQQMQALKRFMFKLNDERNRRMLQRISGYLQQGNSFIAVGALHLAGQTGLVQQLKDQGYQLTTIR